ncbi:hypothetical protein Va3_309 [Vibrio phage Va3]|nr:hypothetical protein Va3_309 [Vibrio phage Va3]
MQTIDVRERLPRESGTYLCIRYGMPYKPEPIEFDAGDEQLDEEARWFDSLSHVDGGGGGVKRYCELTNAEKYWRTNFGKVIYWFEAPENHMSGHDFKDYMIAELSSRGIDPDEITGGWEKIEHGDIKCIK